MEALTARQVIARALALGLTLGAGALGVLSLRAAYAITCGRRWYQLREL